MNEIILPDAVSAVPSRDAAGLNQPGKTLTSTAAVAAAQEAAESVERLERIRRGNLRGPSLPQQPRRSKGRRDASRKRRAGGKRRGGR